MSSKIVRGSGGGDEGTPRTPVESPDSLQSRAYIRIVDLISEGEIVGLVNGRKSIYLNETPVQDESGAENFGNSGAIVYEERKGTQSQTYMKGFTTVENEVTVGVEIFENTPIIRQVTNPNIDRIRVRVSVPALYRTDRDTGDTVGTSVRIRLYIRPNGGSFVYLGERTISGKSSGKYETTASFATVGDGPWDVKVQRMDDDSDLSYLQNKTTFESYTEIVDAKLRYPNSAVIGIRLDSAQFSQVPTRYYHVGLLKILVPSNYDSVTRTYTGTWDGTFQLSSNACDNPAWVFYDILTNNRYGLGAFIPVDQVDKWSLYEIARYCDELVPDGFGSFEPRFTCNILLQSREEAYNVLQNLASIFRGMIYWAAGSVTVSQDSPQDASYLFTPANVFDGKFSYQGASSKVRHSVALVSWNDPEDFYRLKVEYVEDSDAVARFGVNEIEITAMGCTSRGQAHRLGKWLLYTEQYEAETVTFKTGLDGLVSRPGQVIKIADPTRAGVRMGGRISSATTTTVTVDSDLSGSFAGNTLSVMMPDASIEETTIVSYSGRTFTVQPPLSEAPNAQSIWIAKSDTVEPQTYRVLSVKEDDDGFFTLTAIKHDPDKFAAIENDLVLEPKSYSILSAAPDAPQNLAITETLYQSGAEVKSKATISWNKVNFATSYLVRYVIDDNNAIEQEVSYNELELIDTRPGNYFVQIASLNAVGKKSAYSEFSKYLFGKTATPKSVENFSMIPGAGLALLSWDKAVDLDVLVGGSVRIRHTPRTSGQSWSDAIDIIPAVAGTATSANAPLLSGTYMVKFVDSSGYESDTASMIVTTVPDVAALNVVDTQTEHPAFSGAKANMALDTTENALVLNSLITIDEIPDIDSVGSFDFPGRVATFGTYDFQNTIDLGGVWPFRIRSTIDLEAFATNDIIDARVDPIDTWASIDGDIVSDVNAALYVRTTEDNPAGTPTWTEWKLVSAAEYVARGIQFQLRCTSAAETHNLYIRQLQTVIDMADRTESSASLLTSGTGTTFRVDYAEYFFDDPSVGITAFNMNSGDYYVITNADYRGFDIVFKNAGGTTVSRNFNFLSKGYGRKVG